MPIVLKSKSGLIIETNWAFLFNLIKLYLLFIIYLIYPLDFPAKFIDEPSARSNTTIVFASDTPSGIFRALVLCPRATADKSTARNNFSK